jgi:hypothetical protein
MQPRQVRVAKLLQLVHQVSRGSESAVGSYLVKDFHIQISRYKLPTSQRVSMLYHRRRNQGLCTQCGKKVTRKNPRTKKLYRLCDYHRRKIDRAKK